MILKALYDYYHRDKNPVPYGWMKAALSFIIVINQNGQFVRVEDSRDKDGIGKIFLVPKGEHTNSVSPLLFWDNLMYALDLSSKISEHEKHLAFVDKCNKIASLFNSPSLNAVVAFYQNGELQKVYKDPLWDDMKKNPKASITFRIEGSPFVILEEEIFEEIVKWEDLQIRKDCLKAVCLITGKNTEIVRVGTKTPIIGCKNSSKLVAFQKDLGFDSYGKSQGGNAPISLEAEFAYSTALMKLKEDGSRNKFMIGDRTFLFWASNDSNTSKKVEENLFFFLGIPQKENDPNQNIEQVRAVFESIYDGPNRTSQDDTFFILGLAPNSGRIAVIYWAEIPLYEFAKRINRHFSDMDITGGKDSHKTLWSIVNAIKNKKNNKNSKDDKDKGFPPNLPDALVKSIFQGLPYPQTLYSSCIRRIKAEITTEKYNEAVKKGYITIRAAIIKAYLNRLINNNEQKIEEMLDQSNNNQGYLCGRLFAVLDKIQEEANKQHTIRERYMNSASATPAAVFSTILNLSLHHSEKLEERRNVWFEKLKQEIIEKLDADGFPAHLDLQDQGRFFVGYYHQRQKLFTKNEKEENNNNQ